MTTAVQNNSCGFINFCQNETNNLFAKCPSSAILLEIIRRVAVIASIIIPLIGLLANCANSNQSTIAKADEADSTQQRTSSAAIAITPQMELSVIPTDSFQYRLQTRMPHLHEVIRNFQHGNKLTREEYEAKYRKILLNELGMTEQEIFSTNYFGNTTFQRFDFEDLLSKILVVLTLDDKILFDHGEAYGSNFREFGVLFGSGNGGYGLNLLRENQSIPLTDHQGKEMMIIAVSSDLVINNNLFNGSVRSGNEQFNSALDTCIQLLAHLCV